MQSTRAAHLCDMTPPDRHLPPMPLHSTASKSRARAIDARDRHAAPQQSGHRPLPAMSPVCTHLWSDTLTLVSPFLVEVRRLYLTFKNLEGVSEKVSVKLTHLLRSFPPVASTSNHDSPRTTPPTYTCWKTLIVYRLFGRARQSPRRPVYRGIARRSPDISQNGRSASRARTTPRSPAAAPRCAAV